MSGPLTIEWTSYSKDSPKIPGMYRWRMKHRLGFSIEFDAEVYKRGSGHVVPEFSHWDGWTNHMPDCEWKDSAIAKKGNHHAQNLKVIEVGFVSCPFCGEVPTIQGTSDLRSAALYFERPTCFNVWWLECCHWVKPVYFKTPSDLAAAWNGRIEAAILKAKGASDV